MKKSTQEKIDALTARYSALSVCREDLLAATKILVECWAAGGKILVCGNGGSASDAEHIVGELMKGFILPRKLDARMQAKLRDVAPDTAEYLIKNLQGALPAVSLVNETALNTAFANDQAADLVFAQQVLGLANAGDVLIAISTSGNSANVIHAVNVARAQGAKSIALVGATGGRLKNVADVAICAPADETYKIQEYHLPIYHALCIAVEEEFFGEQ